ncbi:hypothetical protein BKG83_21690 [Mycobacteroides chelonae]|jgi:hypothetical protein|uniref:Prokaryotic cytochrome C oxidase subunit IV family protein n=1 Tax=Mycobacteroides chelonae TaxID=1774 RepID=A0A1S1LZ60_MYCCH|nr:cytochrome C oxidase subunit IV family protein [Mycobacteroides chelonae]PKQ58626.1 hypothetical protein B5566_07275 [Mycobacterium sp. MHSD3]SKL82195.1 Uncharacterised protein [Mycobacteroides abscessus subsp. bolletii]AYM42485.1 hypothetical protein DYE20_13835 [[Mycobacterium] chelonae subsp. gwanakae]MBF9521802.1 cytochrome C oxidase subunit IV family protein [Mycobacteroides chelonae]OHT82049.1 hypothetical protein BKG69_02075 [Mycobacteroides chelonae]
MTISSLHTRVGRTALPTWLALTVCTVLSWSESSPVRPSNAVILIVLSLTAVKAVLIIASYMEINRAPRWLQTLCGTWIIVVFAILTYTLCVAA